MIEFNIYMISQEAVRNHPSMFRGKSKTKKIFEGEFSVPRKSKFKKIFAETRGLFSYA